MVFGFVKSTQRISSMKNWNVNVVYFSDSEFEHKVKWNNPKYVKDLNVDGYKWRLNGSRKVKIQRGTRIENVFQTTNR